VFSGGLSSYSIMLMVIAHLQSEGLRAAHAVALAAAEGAGDAQDADRLLTGLRAALRPAAAAESAPSHADLGPLLCSFFDRFGKRFRCGFTGRCAGILCVSSYARDEGISQPVVWVARVT